MPAFLIFLALVALTFFAVRAFRERSARAAPRQTRVTEQLSDPREAAAILLVQQAAYEGHVSQAHKTAILALMSAQFGAEPSEADGFYAFARMAVGQTGDAANSLRRLLGPIKARCTLAEMKALADMLVQVGETGGPMNEAQKRLVQDVRRALSLPEPDQDSV